MRRFLSSLLVVSAFIGGANVADAGYKKTSLPPLPFETYFAKDRTDSDVLKFNDFSGKIKAQRIKKLLRSGPILGDRVLLDNNLAVYFPEGYIVSSTMHIEQFRPKNGMSEKQIKSANDIEMNPEYDLVNKIDHHLGKVCAEIPSPENQKTRLRRNEEGILSLVKRTQGRFDKILGKQSEDVMVISALEPHYLSSDRKIQLVASNCI